MKKAKIIFEDGVVFNARIFAEGNDTLSEIVFNTAMTGYQEILTDPSYTGQSVVMTYPMIGNYGINEEDVESRRCFLDAMIVREYVDTISNWRANKTLKQYLEENNVIGLTDVDTRALTRYLRDQGAKRALITSSNKSVEELLQETDLGSGMAGTDLARFVSCEKAYPWHKPSETKYRVAVIDCGVKYSILDMLKAGGCECDIYSIRTHAETILSQNYDGLFISNGPGDPEPVKSVINLVQELNGKLPIYGICLGHQIIGLANGLKTYKLKFGHHGANHPIKNLDTTKVEVTSQNHNFAISSDGIEDTNLRVTHLNLNDQTVAGLESKDGTLASVQFHPEAGPGPHDSRYFFLRFYQQMDRFTKRNQKVTA